MTGTWHFRACLFVFYCCLLLGGGTRSGFLSDAVLQLICVPLLLWSLWRIPDLPNSKAARLGLLFCAAVALLPLLQIIPLPPGVWSRFPSRAPELATYEALQAPVPWLPISVFPEATILSALSLIPPSAIFLSVLVLDGEERRKLTFAFVIFGAISVFVGLTQISQGPSSSLRFFEVTNPTDAVGFFANRNHYAALLYCALIFTMAWTVDVASTDVRGGRYRTWRVVFLIAGLTTVIALVASSAMARSRAGVALTVLALFGGFLLALRGRRSVSQVTPVRLLGAAVAVGMIMVLQFALYRVLERFSDDPLQDSRSVFARQTLLAAEAYFPFGSGMGTFTRVYPIFETPRNALVDTYVNRAHNDVIEFVLEGGAFSIALMLLFGLKFSTSVWTAWVRRSADGPDIDATLVQAATIALFLLSVHSLVDYPLRTSAIGAVFALAAGLMFTAPEGKSALRARGGEDPGDFASQEQVQPSLDAQTDAKAAVDAPSKPVVRKPWGQDIDWPDAWKSNRSSKEQK